MAKLLEITENKTGDVLLGTTGRRETGELDSKLPRAGGVAVIVTAASVLDSATITLKARPENTDATPEPIKKSDDSTALAAGDQETLSIGDGMDLFYSCTGGGGSLAVNVFISDLN